MTKRNVVLAFFIGIIDSPWGLKIMSLMVPSKPFPLSDL